MNKKLSLKKVTLQVDTLESHLAPTGGDQCASWYIEPSNGQCVPVGGAMQGVLAAVADV